MRDYIYARLILLISILCGSVVAQQPLVIYENLIVNLGTPTSIESPISFLEAFQRGIVSTTFKVEQTFPQITLGLEIKNLTQEHLSIFFPSGLALDNLTNPPPYKTSNTQSLAGLIGDTNTCVLPIEGGIVKSVSALCTGFYLPQPNIGDIYNINASQPSQYLQSNNRPTITNPIRQSLVEFLPTHWIDQGEIDFAVTRVNSLICFAETGIQAASLPFDFLLLPIVRQYLDRSGLKDPYETPTNAEPQTIQQTAARIFQSQGNEPRDFTALTISDYSPGTTVAILDESAMFHVKKSGIKEFLDQTEWLVQQLESRYEEEISDFYRHCIPISPVSFSQKELELQVSVNEAIVKKLIEQYPEEIRRALQNDWDMILGIFSEVTFETSSERFIKTLMASSNIPLALKQEWNKLLPVIRGQVSNCLLLASECDFTSDKEKEVLSEVFNNAPTAASAFLKDWEDVLTPLSASVGVSVRRKLDSASYTDILEKYGLSQMDREKLEGSFYRLAQARHNLDQLKKSLSRQLVADIQNISENEIARLATDIQNSLRILSNPTSIQMLGQALKEKGVALFKDPVATVPGCRGAAAAYSIISKIRIQAMDSEQVIYRLPGTLSDVQLHFWNVLFEEAGLEGFENEIDFIRTRKKNIVESFQSIQSAYSGTGKKILIVTVPSFVNEDEYANPTSDFVRNVKEAHPEFTAGDYNASIGANIEREVNKIRSEHPDIQVGLTFGDLKRFLESESVDEDVSLSLTVIAHEMAGPGRIEFPDVPNGVSIKDLKAVLELPTEKHSTNLEANLIVCHSGDKPTIELLKSSAAKVVTAPQGEIEPVAGLRLYARAIEIMKERNVPLWKGYCIAGREMLKTIMSLGLDKETIDKPLLQSPESFPSPEARRRQRVYSQMDLIPFPLG